MEGSEVKVGHGSSQSVMSAHRRGYVQCAVRRSRRDAKYAGGVFKRYNCRTC